MKQELETIETVAWSLVDEEELQRLYEQKSWMEDESYPISNYNDRVKYNKVLDKIIELEQVLENRYLNLNEILDGTYE